MSRSAWDILLHPLLWIVLGVIAFNGLFLGFPSVMWNWHDRISGWPECVCTINGESVVDKDLSPSWRTSAEALVTVECEVYGTLDATLKYPPVEWLNYASEESTNEEVATWRGNFVVHVNPSQGSDGRHEAYVSPPDITTATVVGVLAVVVDIVCIIAGVVLFILD